MAITVEALKLAAIGELGNMGYATTDFITPTIYGRAINFGLDDFWAKCVDMNLDLYAFRGSTLAITTAAQEYAVSSTTMRITAMFVRSGTSPNYTYEVVCPLQDSRDHYYAYITTLYPGFNITGMSAYSWFESKQALDGSGNWIRYVQLEPYPTSSFTIVYDGTREITKVAVPPTSESSTYIDIPNNCLLPLALRVLKWANLRDKMDISGIDRQIVMADDSALKVHRRGLQWQQAKRVVRT